MDIVRQQVSQHTSECPVCKSFKTSPVGYDNNGKDTVAEHRQCQQCRLFYDVEYRIAQIVYPDFKRETQGTTDTFYGRRSQKQQTTGYKVKE